MKTPVNRMLVHFASIQCRKGSQVIFRHNAYTQTPGAYPVTGTIESVTRDGVRIKGYFRTFHFDDMETLRILTGKENN